MSSQLDLFGAELLKAQQRADAPTFHVRAHMPVEEVKAGERRAEHQEARILEWLIAHPGARLTAFDIHQGVAGADKRADHREAWPLTSTRRALTGLKNRGLVRRHDEDRRPGGYGALNATWSLAE